MTASLSPAGVQGATAGPCEPCDTAWVSSLQSVSPEYDGAVRRLHELVTRAVRVQASHMPHAWSRLGSARLEELIATAADDATVAILGKLHTFQCRSRFTTWAYKFGILHANMQIRRALRPDHQVALDQFIERADESAMGPEAYAQAKDLTAAVRVALDVALTAHQRRVVIAVLLQGVPIDVLAQHLGTSRNALYKTIHDARVRLRRELAARGFLDDEYPEEARS